jgi:hypothetical protein
VDYRKSQESVWRHTRIRVNSKNRGILDDPELVDACLRLFNEKGYKFE